MGGPTIWHCLSLDKMWCVPGPSPPLLTGSTDSHSTPGPGAYTPEQVNVNKRSAPKHSLGIRHSEYVTPLILEVPE